MRNVYLAAESLGRPLVLDALAGSLLAGVQPDGAGHRVPLRRDELAQVRLHHARRRGGRCRRRRQLGSNRRRRRRRRRPGPGGRLRLAGVSGRRLRHGGGGRCLGRSS